MALALPCSIVVAAHGPGARLDQCLSAYARQLRPGDELLAVVATGRDPTIELREMGSTHPGVRFLAAPLGTLTPRLWALGLAEAGRPLVQVTIAPCVPDADWRVAMGEGFEGDLAAVGGAIAPGRALRLRDWAVLFLRYRAYLPPFPRHRVPDVPGDNATYRRAALEEVRALWTEEFWEYEVNAELVRRGRSMVMDPAMGVRYEGGEPAWDFFRQRFRHGVRFGRMRLLGAPASYRLALAATLLLPGLVLLAKVAGSVLRHGRHWGRFFASLPWLCLYLTAWAGGEWWGYVIGAPVGGSPGDRAPINSA